MQMTVKENKVSITSDPKSVKGDFIYVKKDMAPFFAVPFDRLYGVICDIGDNAPFKSGIPDQLITKLDMAENTPTVLYKDNQTVAYFLPEGYGTAEDVLNIISIFNGLSSTKLTIYLTKKTHGQVQGFANDHINFVEYINAKDIEVKASKFITYGYCARSFIGQKVPTIIIGPNGIGGWVTPDNIEYLLKDGFMGRPGGRLHEPVPMGILVDEFMEIEGCERMQELLDENASCLKEYLEKHFSNPKDGIRGGLEYYKNVHAQLNDTIQRNGLKPILASNVFRAISGNSILIQRSVTNDLLFSLEKDEMEFLDDLNGSVTYGDLIKKYEMETEEFWEIMNTLWERKAIVF